VGLALNAVPGPLRSNGIFVLPSLDDGTPYTVTVYAQPTTPSQTCEVANATGTLAGGDVANVDVTCTTDQFAIGGTVSGLATGNSVVLQNNAGDDLTISNNGVFAFATALDDESTYAVLVLTQPTSPDQTCTVGAGSGTLAAANVTDITVTCVTEQFSIGGTVTGLAAGNSVVLQNNGGDDLVVSANGSFVIPTALDDGSSYAVTVFTQPGDPSQFCTVTGGSGTNAGALDDDIVVDCALNGVDLVASITDGSDVVAAGMPLTYMIQVRNLGPVDAENVIVQSALDAALSDATWECVPGDGAGCPDSGSGDIDVLVDIPAGSVVAFVLTAQLSADFAGVVESSIVALAPEVLTELSPADNAASDMSGTVRVFGDGFEVPAANVKAWLISVLATD
jgi:uncharacterized repeat protein (TIGR01451 family)